MSEFLKMSKKCLLLKDIKNYLKKLESGQLEIEAGQWELHKDVMILKKIFDEFKNFKEDFEEMKKSSLEQMGIIRKLESALFQKSDDVCPKKNNNRDSTDDIYKNTDKRKAKNCNKEPKKSHIVQSEEIIEITSHVESTSSKSGCDSKSEDPVDRRRKREAKKHSSTPLCSIIYYPKLDSGSGVLNSKIRFPVKKKKNAMLQRYLNDSAKYCDEKASSPVPNVVKSAETCEKNHEEGEEYKNDFCRSFNSTPRCFKDCDSDTSAERKFGSHNPESLVPKSVSHSKERKVLMMSSQRPFSDKSKRKKKESTYVCGACKKAFNTKDLLKAHEVVHRKMSDNFIPYKCDYCSNLYKTPEILEKHIRKCQLIRSIFRKS